jgi:NAD(P)-dependent dehydrogenase (short-subunit alcohol dehydrogenase family)
VNTKPVPASPPIREESLAGRVIVITGAGQGIGRAFAHAFASAGSISIVAEIDKHKAERVTGEITAAGGRAAAFQVDVTNASGVEQMMMAVHRQFGRIDVLINNAAIFSTLTMRPFDEIPLDEWDRVLRTNITGPFLCSRSVASLMRAAGWGRIINMSSAAVTQGRTNYLHYTTSKSALIGMTNSLARELGPHGVTVNAVLPGATVTEIPRATVTPEQKKAIVAMQCIPRAQIADDLVGIVLFLASEASAFITGQSITVDGGSTHR